MQKGGRWVYHLCDIYKKMKKPSFCMRSYLLKKRTPSIFLEGALLAHQQDALHLHSAEDLLVTFLMVIPFTSFQYPSGITLKKVRLKNIT
jgi:hypothetical protein